VSGLKLQYKLHGHKLEEAINSILEKNQRLKKEFKRLDLETDKLYLSELTHPADDEASCAEVCDSNPSKLVPRNLRTQDDDNLAVHYGIVASAN